MELYNQNKRDGYVYDPIIKGYDSSFWATTTGTPAMSGTVLRFNASAASTYLQHEYADVEFDMTVPAVPTSGDVRTFGLQNPSSNGLGGAYFNIAGTAFTLKTYDDNGNLTTTTLTWSAGYTATPTLFRLRWEPDQIIAYINGVIVATIQLSGGNIPNGPLAIRIVNGNADNMDLTYLRIRRAAGVV